jgi:hypothetical protein
MIHNGDDATSASNDLRQSNRNVSNTILVNAAPTSAIFRWPPVWSIRPRGVPHAGADSRILRLVIPQVDLDSFMPSRKTVPI